LENNSTTTLLEIIENEPRISHRLIAEQTDNSQVSIRKLIDKHIDKLELFGVVSFEMTAVSEEKLKENPDSKPVKTYYLNEPQATLLLTFMRNNEIVVNFKVRLVNDFFEMREKLQQKSKPNLSIQDQILGLESAIKILKVNEASKILMLSTLYKEHGLSTSYLPKYSDEQHTYSLSHLLKKFEVEISAKKLNLILISEGYLEIKTRKSTGSFIDEKTKEKKPKLRTFKSLTEKGLEFGKNVISPHNQLETSPHYFENKFEELIEALEL